MIFIEYANKTENKLLETGNTAKEFAEPNTPNFLSYMPNFCLVVISRSFTGDAPRRLISEAGTFVPYWQRAEICTENWLGQIRLKIKRKIHIGLI